MQWDQTRSCISPHSLRIWAYHQPSDIHTLNWIRAKVRERGVWFFIFLGRETRWFREGSLKSFPIPKPDYTPLQFFFSKGWRSVGLLKRSPPLPFPQFDVWSSFRICFNSIFVTSITWRLSMIYTAMFIRSATAQRDFQRWRQRRKPEALPPSKCCQKFTMISAPYFDVWFVRAKDSTHSSKNDRSWPKILVTPFADLLLASWTNQDQKGLVK